MNTQQQEDNKKVVVANSAVKNALGERLRGSNATASVKLVAGMVSGERKGGRKHIQTNIYSNFYKAGGLAEACLLQPLE
jgi:hypothetical protein